MTISPDCGILIIPLVGGFFFCAYWDRHSPGVREVFKTGLPEFYQEVPKK